MKTNGTLAYLFLIIVIIATFSCDSANPDLPIKPSPQPSAVPRPPKSTEVYSRQIEYLKEDRLSYHGFDIVKETKKVKVDEMTGPVPISYGVM